MPAVTVVIPTYNRARFLSGALRSVIRQTFADWEAIVVNNYSEDDTQEEVVRFNDPRIRLVNFRNHGIIAASRNLGILQARGEWIAFLDSDDIWYPTKLEQCLLVCANREVSAVCHGERWVGPNQSVRDVVYGPESRCTYESLLFDGNCLSPSAVLVRREILLKAGLFSEEPELVMVEDYDLWLRLAKNDIKFKFLPEMLGECRIHPGGNSQAVDRHAKASSAVVERHLGTRKQTGLVEAWRRRRARARVLYGYGRSLQRQGRRWLSCRLFVRAIVMHPLAARFYIAIGMNCVPGRWHRYQERWYLAQNKLGRADGFIRGGDWPRAIAAQQDAIKAAWWWWKPYVNYLCMIRANPGAMARILGGRSVIGLAYRPLRWARWLLRLARLQRSDLAPVCLVFHDIPAADTGRFRRLMEFLSRNYDILDYETFVRRLQQPVQSRRTALLITFDDGFASSRAATEQVLAPLGIRAVFFVPTDFIEATAPQQRLTVLRDGIFAGQRDVSEDVERFAPMSWNDLVVLAHDGHTIGAHTKSHRRLSALAGGVLQGEIEGCADVIEQRLGSKVRTFAVPFGNVHSVSPEALAISASKYETTFTVVRGSNQNAPWHALRRETVEPTDPPHYLGFMIEGGLRWRYRAAARALDLMAKGPQAPETRR